ncbi:hypothetical protein SMMN14_09244 [Sphaerulina musiva]
MGQSSDNAIMYEVRETEFKGQGVFATQNISPGTVIVQEGRLMEVAKTGDEYTQHDLEDAFAVLLESERQSVLALSASSRPADEPLLTQIMKSNAFGDGTSTWLHPTICRINHSCIPNATSHHDECCLGDVAQIIAEREICAGEEICISYNSQMHELCTAKERSVLLRNQYGFNCYCPACSPLATKDVTTKQQQHISDTRRRLIAELLHRLTGLHFPPHARQIMHSISTAGDDIMSVPKEDLAAEQGSPSPLSDSQRYVYFLLLAHLRRAEGLESQEISNSYWLAAEALLRQLMTLPDVVILDWAAQIKHLMELAIEVLDRVRDPFDHDPQRLRNEWGNMQKKMRLKASLTFLDSEASSIVPGSADDIPFALRIFPDTKRIEVLSEMECNAIVRQNYAPVSQEDPIPKKAKKPRSDNAYVNFYEDVKSACWNSSKTTKFGAAMTCLAPVLAAYWYAVA